MLTGKQPMPLERFILQDRQWTRTLRIQHAQSQLSRAPTAEDRAFWLAVLERNGST